MQIYSDNIAHYLIQQKLPIGSPVIVYGGQTFSMLACFLGVVKAGHPYIPVDDQSSPQRLVDISQRSGAEFCLALANLPVDLEDINLVKDEKIKKIFATAHQNADKRIFTQETDIFYPNYFIH
ncbi:AMP-binding protein [Ligilactobacillus acidipiscis]|uniref:AMP-binding protein n=1 Tax=Ligilactobacillus acidipiscis TaxID=89059 RepID=UPI0009E711A0|nr:AMP-binding protein [Ligilactobacillus acidipiscis]